MKQPLGVAAALVIGMALVQAPPASASDVCVVSGLAYSTKTLAFGDSTCHVQARIDRYVSSAVKTYVGTWGVESLASATVGVNAGNAYRWQSGGGVSAWHWL